MSSVVAIRIVGGIFLLFSVCGVITVTLLYTITGGEIPFEYGIMLDAGSTKTQVTLYKWDGEKEKGTGIVNQVDTCRVKGGLHKDTNIFQAGETILPCLNNVSQPIPDEKKSKTPLYLGATAGMRMLRLKDHYKADGILLGTKYTLLTKTNFLIKDVNIISGREEGIFAWVTGNFLLDKLISDRNNYDDTFGALEMGGASTQISFEMPPRDVDDIDNQTTDTMTLYGKDHLVFSQSYLCFGINEAMRRHRAILADGKDGKSEIIDPCGFKNDVVNYPSDDLYGHLCTQALTREENMNKVYKFRGTGDNNGCSAAVQNLISNKNCKNVFKSHCFAAPTEKISNVKYLAVATFYYTAEALNVTNATLSEYKDAIDTYCTLSREEAESRLNNYQLPYIADYCLEAHYVHHILIKEYGFNDTTWSNINFMKEVAGSDLGWSLGYMINATNAIPKGKPNKPVISYPTFVVLEIIFSCLAVAAIILLLLPRFQRSRQSFITVLP